MENKKITEETKEIKEYTEISMHYVSITIHSCFLHNPTPFLFCFFSLQHLFQSLFSSNVSADVCQGRESRGLFPHVGLGSDIKVIARILKAVGTMRPSIRPQWDNTKHMFLRGLEMQYLTSLQVSGGRNKRSQQKHSTSRRSG